MLCACTTRNMHSALAGERLIHYDGITEPSGGCAATHPGEQSHAHLHFFAAEAYGSVPQNLLPRRLFKCDVPGPAFTVLSAKYSSAYSRVRVVPALSPAFAVQRCVAQGCPLSPLLHSMFVYPAGSAQLCCVTCRPCHTQTYCG